MKTHWQGAADNLRGLSGLPADVAAPWVHDADQRLTVDAAEGELTRLAIARVATERPETPVAVAPDPAAPVPAASAPSLPRSARMIRGLWFFLQLAILVVAAVWLAQQPGCSRCDGAPGHRYLAGMLIVIVLVLAAALVLLWRLWRIVNATPHLIDRLRRQRRRTRGYASLVHSLAATPPRRARWRSGTPARRRRWVSRPWRI